MLWGGEEDSNPKAGDEEDEAKEQSIRRMAGKNMIRECPIILRLSPDPESDGVLILDPHLGPRWRLVRHKTKPTIVYLPKVVEKVTILDRKDEVLDCRQLS